MARLDEVRNVLVLCNGNICRSPYGEVRLRDMLSGPKPIEVVSRGFIRPGRPAPQEAQSVAKERGLDLAGHRSELLTREVAAEADLTVVMSTFQAKTTEKEFGVPRARILNLGDLDPAIPESRTILDPHGHPLPFFREVYDRMDRCLAELVSVMGESH